MFGGGYSICRVCGLDRSFGLFLDRSLTGDSNFLAQLASKSGSAYARYFVLFLTFSVALLGTLGGAIGLVNFPVSLIRAVTTRHLLSQELVSN